MKSQQTLNRNLTISLQCLGYDIDTFVTQLTLFASQYTDYRGEEIKDFVKTVTYFKRMFCCGSSSAHRNTHEQRVTIVTNNEEAERNAEEVAGLRALLAEKDKELKEEKARRSQCEKQIQQSQQLEDAALFQVELSKRQNHIAELTTRLNEEKRATKQLSHEVKGLKLKNLALMSAQEEFGVESKDKYLPGKIASMCRTLFREQYTDARHFCKRQGYQDGEIYENLGERFL